MRSFIPLLLLTAACSGAPKAAPGPRSALETSTSAADQLALAVFRAAGGDRWHELSELEFHFVVYEGDTKKADIHHRWKIRENKDHVLWTDREGVPHDELVDIAKKSPEKGYARWVNDTYWLILPLKLLDPGVRRVLEADREHNGKTYKTLRISFAQVGLTPGDVYWLFVEPTTDRIERWEMVLEGAEPPPVGYSFEDHRAVGPLTLALEHKSDDGKRRVTLEGVAAK